MTEEEAIRLIREGQPQGLEYLIGRYTSYAGAVVWSVIGKQLSRRDAEEVVSDVFIALWRHGYSLCPGKVKSYIGAAARNGAINKLRSRGRELSVEEDILTLPQDGPEELLERKEQAQLVRDAVQAMPQPDREIFVRYYYYCESAADIAGRLGMTPAAVRQRLKRGRDRLREKFVEGEVFDGTPDNGTDA